MKREFDALRRIAHLASHYLELEASLLGDTLAKADTLHELRVALNELSSEFPYLLTLPARDDLDATLSRNLHPGSARN